MKLSDELLASEKERFNGLTQADAKRIADECEGAASAIRSCWYCNGAHDHLKTADFFTCFACGISYVRGYPIPILGMRMRGEDVDDVTMQKLQVALETGD